MECGEWTDEWVWEMLRPQSSLAAVGHARWSERLRSHHTGEQQDRGETRVAEVDGHINCPVPSHSHPRLTLHYKGRPTAKLGWTGEQVEVNSSNQLNERTHPHPFISSAHSTRR